MASDRILQNEISRLGQSQEDRSPAALDPGFAPVDGRSPADRVAEARRLAARHHPRRRRHGGPRGWSLETNYE